MSAPLVSTLADDPDLAPLVEEYVAVLGQRIDEIARAAAAGDRHRTEVLAHQMVGGAGSHGFLPISDAARRLEEAAPSASAELVADRVRELAALCARARAR
jgi:HPt (histidine-containing phosphotransfer) domain-containing protein